MSDPSIPKIIKTYSKNIGKSFEKKNKLILLMPWIV